MIDSAERTTTRSTICVAIPTYKREQVLVDTIKHVLAQEPPADEVLVIDQSVNHERSTLAALEGWHEEGKIRWVKHSPPLLPGARNRALLEARSDIVIFTDDDVILAPGFVEAHRRCYDDPRVDVVAGQVLNKHQPVHSGAVKDYELGFPLNHDERTWTMSMRGCNHSVRRRFALELGGFDEQYVRVGMREESDFAMRAVLSSGRPVLFEPKSSLIHLAAASGGQRSWKGVFSQSYVGGAVGDYYYGIENLQFLRMAGHVAKRSVRYVINPSSLHRPWQVPVRLFGCVASFLWAVWLSMQGRKLLSSTALSTRDESCRNSFEKT
jgi:GT2 family glycosyltransferase